MWDRVERQPQPTVPSPEPMECAVVADHDYCSVPETAGLDMAAVKNEELQKEIELLHRELKELKMQATFGLQRFAGSDDDIRFYTR